MCTAQYFVWFFSLLPLVMPSIKWPLPRSLVLSGGAWVLAQLHWLLWAYLLEFKGQAVYLGVWMAGVVFLAANVWLMVEMMKAVKPTVTFLDGSVQLTTVTRQVPVGVSKKGA